MAVTYNRRGAKTAILDADITGPSIPKAFGIYDKAMGTEAGILPAVTETGIELMSINLLLKEETDPVVWRSPMIVGTVKQFWSDVIWNNVDYMFVDMPPGTGDIPSYFTCPDCGKKHSVFGDSHIEEIAEKYNTRVLAKLPIDPELAAKIDKGQIEAFEGDYLDSAADTLDEILK